MINRAEPVRLVLAQRPSPRDRLHGAWWPRSLIVADELGALLSALLLRAQTVRGVTLNRHEWPGAPLVIASGPTTKFKIGWYGLPEAHLAVLRLDHQRTRSLLVVPPSTPEGIAVRAMLMAAAPGNCRATIDLLAYAALQG